MLIILRVTAVTAVTAVNARLLHNYNEAQNQAKARDLCNDKNWNVNFVSRHAAESGI